MDDMRRILVVDDEAASRLGAMLPGEGFEVVAATDRPSALPLDEPACQAGAAAVVRDVSRPVELAHYKEDMTSLLVHELRNLIAVIRSSLDFAIDSVEGDLPVTEALVDAKHAGARGLRLLANLLDITRLEGSRTALSPIRIDVAALFDGVVSNRTAKLDAVDVTLDMSSGSTASVTADQEMLIRVIENTLDNAHGRQVARLALALFDGTHEVLELPEESRDLLRYAALLHDIGHAVSHDRHHRHTAYLIRNGEFPGFTTREVEVIAETARHHRKQIPKASTPELEALPAKARRTVRALAALLRIADALDRTHTGVLREAAVQVSPARLVIDIDTGGRDGDLELWAAERRVDLLSRLVDRPVRLRVRTKRAPARRRGRARGRSSRARTRTAGA